MGEAFWTIWNESDCFEIGDLRSCLAHDFWDDWAQNPAYERQSLGQGLGIKILLNHVPMIAVDSFKISQMLGAKGTLSNNLRVYQ